MINSNYYILEEVLSKKYNITKDGIVTNKRTGKLVKYITSEKRSPYVLLYNNNTYYNYTKERLIYYARGYNIMKLNKCNICECCCVDTLCNACKEKLHDVRQYIAEIKILLKR